MRTEDLIKHAKEIEESKQKFIEKNRPFIEEQQKKVQAYKNTVEPVVLKSVQQIKKEQDKYKNMCKSATQHVVPSAFSQIREAEKIIKAGTNPKFSSAFQQLQAMQERLNHMKEKPEIAENVYKADFPMPQDPTPKLLKTLINDMENLVQIQEKTLISYQNSLEESKKENNFNRKVILITLVFTLYQAFIDIPIGKFILNFIFK